MRGRRRPAQIVLPRRAFLVGLGLSTGTLALGIRPVAAAGAPKPAAPVIPPHVFAAGGFAPSAFVHVAADGQVTIVSHRSEMGQGIRSTLPALLTDELGAAIDRVRIVQADGDPAYGDQNTDGSASVRDATEAVRRAGAVARTLLIEAAARRWGVAPTACDARDHAIVHAASGRTLGFGELAAAAAALPVPALDKVVLRPWSALRRIGRALPHVDAPDIVAGRAQYGADVRLPGMKIAVIARPPVVGGRVARLDAGPALAVPGVVRVIELASLRGAPRFQPLGGVAVVADHTWAALRGRAALDLAWDGGPNASYDSRAYRDELLALVRAPGTVVRQVGDVDQAMAGAASLVEAEYYVPHLAHATMEPPVAIARWADGGCEVWAPTQDPQGARRAIARTFSLDPAHVTVHVTLLGCGFGRKSFNDFAVEAAVIAHAAGVPVRVQWTREDDLRHDYYLPACAQRLEVALDKSGAVTAWRHRTAFAPIGLTFDASNPHADVWELAEGVTESPLTVPNVRCEHGPAPLHTRAGWLRGVFNDPHAFAVNSFVDELAGVLGRDPRDLMLALIGPPRALTAAELGVAKLDETDARFPIETARLSYVIERACLLARWTEARRAGRAVGLAAHRTEFSYAAWVVSLVDAPGGGFRVDEAWGVIDAGRVLNPDRVIAQMQGAFAFGLSVARYGAITMRDGAVTQSNFHDYRIARIAEVPRALHVEIVPSEAAPGGVGEVGVPPVAPAIANALAALTGRRARELPLS